MTDLLIIRHAIALKREDWNLQGRSDFERPLSERGIKKFKKSLFGLRKLVPEIEALYSSELVRASQTAEILAQAYNNQIIYDKMYNHGRMPREMSEHLQKMGRKHEGQTIAVVGHEPELCILLHLLTQKPLDEVYLKKGGAALVEDFTSETPKLLWLKRPKELRES